ncbi:hypothetical protein KO516_15130 [Citreicella sp. C3M06]|uniref:hypothetical protein n=1 Tax=Citreicella sp. C3M06 TaxID=2841564 RepID=UPI001C097467|nr:hypothetical protein [Citreicella sp. C3M06]MBU2962119.1 hypothetical protein [Citreicella sp. C3M06]
MSWALVAGNDWASVTPSETFAGTMSSASVKLFSAYAQNSRSSWYESDDLETFDYLNIAVLIGDHSIAAVQHTASCLLVLVAFGPAALSQARLIPLS